MTYIREKKNVDIYLASSFNSTRMNENIFMVVVLGNKL